MSEGVRVALRRCSYALAVHCILLPLIAGAAIAGPATACDGADAARWTETERAVVAALHAGEAFDATTLGDDPARRFVAPEFLRALLLCPSLTAQWPAEGVRLQGVLVPAPLDLGLAEVGVRFVCEGCGFAGFLAPRAQFRRDLVLDRTAVQTDVVLAGATLADGFSMIEGVVGGDVDLTDADARRGLQLLHLRVMGGVTLQDAHVAGKLRLDGASLGRLDLTHARIDDQVILSGIDVQGEIVLDKLRAGSDVLLRAWPGGPLPSVGSGGEAATVLRANNATIAGRIEIAQATLAGAVSFDAVRIGEDLWLRDGSVVAGPIMMPFARIGQTFDLSSTRLGGSVDATGATIGGELRLAVPGSERATAPDWAQGTRLVLRNARAASWVDRIDDGADAWPASFDLIRFDYAGMGGLGGDGVDRRDPRWFVAWMSRQQPFSLEPYRRLSDRLSQAGREAAARQVMFAGKQRERQEASGLRRVLLTLQWAFVGYGVHKEVSLVWVTALTVTGWLVVRRTPQARSVDPPLDLVYSFDALIHLVSLRPETRDIRFDGFARWYMYGHKLMGFVLGGFLLAAFAGLFGT